LIVLWYGGLQVLDGEISSGTLTSFLLYTIYLAGGLGALSEVQSQISQVFLARCPFLPLIAFSLLFLLLLPSSFPVSVAARFLCVAFVSPPPSPHSAGVSYFLPSLSSLPVLSVRPSFPPSHAFPSSASFLPFLSAFASSSSLLSVYLLLCTPPPPPPLPFLPCTSSLTHQGGGRERACVPTRGPQSENGLERRRGTARRLCHWGGDIQGGLVVGQQWFEFSFDVTIANERNLTLSVQDVCFHYPSREESKVLKNFNLNIKPNETVGDASHFHPLVGHIALWLTYFSRHIFLFLAYEALYFVLYVCAFFLFSLIPSLCVLLLCICLLFYLFEFVFSTSSKLYVFIRLLLACFSILFSSHWQFVCALSFLLLRVLPVHVKVALVGPSGAGKSTVISLMVRFYDATSGSILIDGHPITSLDPSWLRGCMALVAQEPVLFGCSIRDNIAYSGVCPESNEDGAQPHFIWTNHSTLIFNIDQQFCITLFHLLYTNPIIRAVME
jgi:ABC-type multidrug transport system fused ATPase/permease subunit